MSNFLDYNTIKTTIKATYGSYIKKNGFIEPEAGTPSELQVLLNLVNSNLVSKPQVFPFEKKTTTIDVNGRNKIDLKTEIPDLISVYQIYGARDNLDEKFRPNDEANVTPLRGYTLKNRVLIFTGDKEISNESKITIQYRSQYLVEDSSGNRKQMFERADDRSVIPFGHQNVLIYGLSEHVHWNTDAVSENQQTFIQRKYQMALDNLLNYQEQDNQIKSML